MKTPISDKTKWVAAVSGTAVATSICSAIMTRYLTKLALDREVPDIMKQIEKRVAGSLASNEFIMALQEEGKQLAGKKHEIVEIVSTDGNRLVGHWFPQNHPKRVIIAMHGWRASWYRDFGMVSRAFEKNGCSVLYAEQRGQNLSDGEYMGFGITERYDCLAWANWVNHNISENLPIYLCGVSMGATTVLMASGLDLPQNVCGIIADCGFTSPYAIWKHVANRNLHISFGIRGKVANAIFKRKNQVAADDYSTIDALKVGQIPVILIHGTEDHFVPVEMTYENYKACIAPKRLFVVPGAGHGMSYYMESDAYECAIQEFWKEYDFHCMP